MGYVMNSLLYSNIGWRYAFYIQAILLGPSLFGLIFIPSKYFDLNLFATEQAKMQEVKDEPVLKRRKTLVSAMSASHVQI